jgi:1,4-alpha-glucan branching enzyme
MVRKASTNSSRHARVTFELPADAGGQRVHLCGDFNEWSLTATPLARRKDGRFSTTLTLPAGRAYRYRFLVDEERWENDWSADTYLPNPFGSEDSVVSI